MRKPKHIADLEKLGKTHNELRAFRQRLEPYRISVAWNSGQGVWILSKVNAQGIIGPDTVSLKLGLFAFVVAMNDPEDIARQFEGRLTTVQVTGGIIRKEARRSA